jgi:hypothetical protein
MHTNERRDMRRDPHYLEWLIDEALRDSFPASDPSSVSQP